MRTSLVWRGILALATGVIAVVWPQITVAAFVILFAVFAIGSGLLEAVRAFRSEAAGALAGRLLLAVLDVAAGIVALTWPGITALVLVYWIAAWALVSGAAELFLALGRGHAPHRVWLAVTGLLGIVFGLVLFAQPDIGAITLAQIYGFFSLITAVTLFATASEMRAPRPAHRLHTA
ncbi:HdeD family acid-resistance protein [Actinoplanes sp. CA-054009]